MDVSGSASKVARQRRATDWNRLVVSGIVVTLAALRVRDPTAFERQLFTLINTLPGGLRGPFTRVYQLANLWANGLILVPALFARRWRLARDVVLAALLALVVARILGATIQEGLVRGLNVAVRLGKGPTFPFLRLSIATAVVAAAAPYLPRPLRWLGRATLAVVAPAAMYLGLAYPNDVLAALALGWGVAATIHLTFGSPAGRPTVPQVEASLEELGVSADGVALEPRQPQGATRLAADGPGGRIRIKVLGRDETQSQLFSKLWRSMLYKESGRTLQLTRLQEVEHEAYMVLAARSAGVRAPEVVAAGMAGPGAAILVVCDPPGIPLTDLAADALTDDVLTGVWEQAARLHAARLVHGQLHAGTVVVTSEGPAITAFELARTARSGRDESGDVAELLASLAGLVGPERALRSALAGVERAPLIRALPLLQPAALSAPTRAALGSRAKRKGVLAHLREAGATATGTEPPVLQELHRISAASLVLAVGALVAVAGLMSAVGSPSQLLASTRHVQWTWLAVAFVAAMATNLPAAVALFGTVTHGLPLWPTVELQVGLSFSNVAVPLGGTAMQVRFLQHHGSDLAEAIAAGGLLSTAASAIGWGLVVALALLLSPHSVHLASLPKNLPAIALISLLGLGVAAALVMGLPMLRRMVVPPVRHAAAELWSAVCSPRRLGLMLGGNMAVALLFGLSLSACLVAFGAHVSVWSVIAVAVGISGLAGLVPIPGGGTAVSAVGMSGALVALGVSQVTAVGAVLANQVVATYLPAIPGWFATRDLVKRDHL